MKKILISLAVVGAVGAIVAGATGAFFSDTETSTGNTFTAGAIDLKIDNTSYVTNNDGVLVASPNTSWALGNLSDLGTQGGSDLPKLFFNFTDLKPGDIGEDTISIHVDNNDAWVCMATRITADKDNSITEPEKEDGDDGSDNNGELDEELNFIFWADDGDNVLEQDELDKGVFEGTIRDFANTSPRIVADSKWNIFTSAPGTPLVGGDDYHIAKAWCFGTLTPDPLVQDGFGNTRTPLEGTGINCDGTNVNNQSQTDSVEGDIEFFAVQSRNNSSFLCETDYVPSWSSISG